MPTAATPSPLTMSSSLARKRRRTIWPADKPPKIASYFYTIGWIELALGVIIALIIAVSGTTTGITAPSRAAFAGGITLSLPTLGSAVFAAQMFWAIASALHRLDMIARKP